MIQLLVTGKSGRMGQAVIEAADQEPAVLVSATHDAGENLAAAIAQANTVIDFTIHKFTRELVDAALKNGTHLVIGTTGHTDEERAAIREAGKTLPIVYAPNFSVGVNTLFWLTRKAAQILTQDRFDIEVTEMHHRHKIDAPSGTARRLLEILNEETGTTYENDIAHGRFGNVGPRPRTTYPPAMGPPLGGKAIPFVQAKHKNGGREMKWETYPAAQMEAAAAVAEALVDSYNLDDVVGHDDIAPNRKNDPGPAFPMDAFRRQLGFR
jgi:4-hydroxy-tetrahydrodipicolinate reductase